MAPKTSGEKDDWMKQLDAELEKQTQEIMKDAAELQTQMGALNKTLISDFDRIKERFDKQRVFLTMEPQRSVYAQQDDTQEKWDFKNDFRPEEIRNIQLIDRTQEQGRMGDSLKVWYYNDNGVVRMRMIFEYCEGEHYYKYAGWKRVFGQFVVYDAALSDVEIDEVHDKMAVVVKAWYESHLRHNREVLINALKENFEKGETFTE
ncbi:MAG: hypothetical protein A4E31_00377 [Methanomassiliicoccales archaeon PtaU1.Bin030]|jgi:hypothetical protein|nr:MAG: hypothetical protein A4E31_00377 [Methanomassiliicoccales archaeon PtaU1.Bin030]